MKNKFFAIAFLGLAFGTILISSCDKKVGECDTTIACTEVFTSIDIVINDTLDKPYILDSYTVVPEAGGDPVYSKTINPATDTTGIYTVLSDNEKSKVTKDGVYFKFIGIKNGVEVVNEPYRLAHDCCHVVIKSGLPKVTVK